MHTVIDQRQISFRTKYRPVSHLAAADQIMYMAITIIYGHIHQMNTLHRLKRDIPINDFFQCECYKNA